MKRVLALLCAFIVTLVVMPPTQAHASASTSTVKLAWAYVALADPKASHWNSVDDALVGTGVEPPGVFRSFFRMDISPMHGKKLFNATFQGLLNSGACDPTIELWLTGPIGPETTWLNQPAWKQNLGTGTVADGFDSCFFNWRISDLVRQAVAAGERHLTFGLRAASEVGPRNLRTFETDQVDHPYWGRLRTPVLRFQYNTVPEVPTDPAINLNDSCGAEPRPTTTFVSTATPTLGAEVANADQKHGDRMSARFEWADSSGTVLGSATSYPGWEGRHCTEIPEGLLVDGQTYRWRVRAEDHYQEPETLEMLSDSSDWTAWQEFTVDVTPPTLPVIASETYPENATGGLIGTPGVFSFSPGESTDVVSYRYRLVSGGPSSGQVTADAGGRASVTLTPTVAFRNTLHVRAVDRAGNAGPERAYPFTPRRNPAPLVASTVYPENAAGGGAGMPGEFAFSPNGAQDVVAYGYSLDSGETLRIPADTPTVTVTPDTAGPHTLSVWSIDARGYLSSARTYAFMVN
ncbi:hypothetical protein [Nonomuraea indica]|uniref:hypothetical protein n=1 Tax=Nonomuraea indica TaxID=1581193 RepID=UPI000C7A53B7|nr:hypothetical protein [Nonomuraea indica]